MFHVTAFQTLEWFGKRVLLRLANATHRCVG
jgi:hypothetical protein